MSQAINKFICPLCGARAGRKTEEIHSGWRRFDCDGCSGQWWEKEGVTAAEMDYEHDAMYKPAGKRRLAWYHQQFLKDAFPTGRLLDIGFGQGEFLHAAVKKGWNCFGIEAAQRNVEIAQEQYGLTNITVETIDSFSERHQKEYNYVSAFEVIEHVQSPFVFLEKIKKVLLPNGYLIVSTPNGKRFGGTCEEWDFPPNHLFRFSEDSLRRLLERSGFETVTVRRQRFANDFFHIRGTLSFSIMKRLRSDGTKETRGRIVLMGLLSVLAGIKRLVFDLVTVPLSWILSLFGKKYWDLYVVARLR